MAQASHISFSSLSLPDYWQFSRFLSDSDLKSICLICDGAWMPTCNQAGLWWILQDPLNLSHIGDGAQACVLGLSLHVELSACLWGLRMVVHLGFSRMLVFSDSALLVRSPDL